MPLALTDVTLSAVTAINHELTVRAMVECLKHCSFADVVLVSDKPVKAPFRVEIMPPFPDGRYYAPFICRNLARYTASPFNLLVQFDSHVVDPGAWSGRFLEYDYIGAKWPWHPPHRRVGNSGFCLRSKKLLDILAGTLLPPTGQFVDDIFICVTIRDWLERVHGIKIAPEDVADAFSYERHTPLSPTFGVHGLFNFWRHTSDDEMERIPRLLDDLYVPSRAYVEVLLHYYASRNMPVFSSLYQRLRDHLGAEPTQTHLLSYVPDPAYIGELITTGDGASAARIGRHAEALKGRV
ncbi:MAG: hypothetical protein M3N08_04985 [Pseudomonadota bacterium]|nr:hypothetical protein [Pseudomonadota bacterium]